MVVVVLMALTLAPRRWQLTLIVVGSCLPFTFVPFGPLSGFRLTEIFALPFLAVVVLQMLATRRSIVARGTGTLWLAVLALAVVAIVNYIRTFDEATAVARLYLDVFSSIAIFVEVAWLAGEPSVRDGDWVRLLRILLLVGVAAGGLRLASFYGGFTLPLLTGTFDYGGTRVVSGVAVNRIGGLAGASVLVLAASAGLWAATSARAVPLLGAAAGLVFAVLSGGRGLTIGVLVGGAVLLLALSPRQRMRYAAGLALVVTMAAWITFLVGESGQVARLTALGGGLARQSPERFAALTVVWRQFLQNPVFGKGIGVPVPGIENRFVEAVVTWGGHSAYTTMLGNFGVLGGFTILLLTLGVAVYAVIGVTRVRRSAPARRVVLGLLTFVVVYVSIHAVELTVGGNGFGDAMLFAVAGLLAGVWPLASVIGERSSSRAGAVGALPHSGERAAGEWRAPS
jgi:hypothetical protein